LPLNGLAAKESTCEETTTENFVISDPYPPPLPTGAAKSESWGKKGPFLRRSTSSLGSVWWKEGEETRRKEERRRGRGGARGAVQSGDGAGGAVREEPSVRETGERLGGGCVTSGEKLWGAFRKITTANSNSGRRE
jgi:hypothetical protein